MDYYSRVVLHTTDNLFLANGRGLYTTILIGNARNGNDNSLINLNFADSASADITTHDSTQHFSNVSSIQINDGNAIEVDTREPELDIIKGNLTFGEIYPRGQLYEKTGAVGEDLNVLGNISLSLYLSDSYSLARHVSIDGFINRIPPLSERP